MFLLHIKAPQWIPQVWIQESSYHIQSIFSISFQGSKMSSIAATMQVIGIEQSVDRQSP